MSKTNSNVRISFWPAAAISCTKQFLSTEKMILLNWKISSPIFLEGPPPTTTLQMKRIFRMIGNLISILKLILIIHNSPIITPSLLWGQVKNYKIALFYIEFCSPICSCNFRFLMWLIDTMYLYKITYQNFLSLFKLDHMALFLTEPTDFLLWYGSTFI